LYREDAPLPDIAASGVAYPAHWAPLLRSWIQQVPLHPGPHPFNRVFGLEFDESFLLRLCREGPSRGERGLAGDIKLVWDYSRGHPLFTNAAAGVEHVATCATFIQRWQEANADTNGPAWTCAMETAIRAVNWIFADVLLDGALASALGPSEFHTMLHRHGCSIWRRLEVRVINSNHYQADLLGLVVLGAIFPDDPEAQSWLTFARDEFPRALLVQTRSDGGLNEASLRYHAFVTEMALLFRLAIGMPLPAPAETRLRQMCQIVADFQDATGDVFPFGDDDSGRVLAVDSASPSGRAETLLRLASTVLAEPFKPARQSVCPQSGWWIRRAGDFTVALDFGGVGLSGLGGHAHNDDFSICLEWRNRPVIIDPGTFLYTSDPEARNQFRSTGYHNTLQVDGCEQRALTSVFAMPGPDKAFEAVSIGENSWAFQRQDLSGTAHRRQLSVSSSTICIRDRIEASGSHRLRWCFQLHPSVRAQLTPQGFMLTLPETGVLLLAINVPAPDLRIIESEYSPGYGRREPSYACTAEVQYALLCSVEWSVRAVG
jgi:hypothetical protein